MSRKCKWKYDSDIQRYYNSCPTPYTWSKDDMRNTIRVIDKNVPKVRVADLAVGAMFRYPQKTSDGNVYMKVNHHLGPAVVLLATGVLYSDFDALKEIEVIDAVEITR